MCAGAGKRVRYFGRRWHCDKDVLALYNQRQLFINLRAKQITITSKIKKCDETLISAAASTNIGDFAFKPAEVLPLHRNPCSVAGKG